MSVGGIGVQQPVSGSTQRWLPGPYIWAPITPSGWAAFEGPIKLAKLPLCRDYILSDSELRAFNKSQNNSKQPVVSCAVPEGMDDEQEECEFKSNYSCGSQWLLIQDT